MVSVTLSKDQIAVEPGSAAAITASVVNRAVTAVRFELEVDGIDPEWLAVPVPAFTLAPGEERSQKILVKPPRSSESKAGTYPFVVSARSLESGEGADAQGILEVEPFHLVSMEIEPKRGSAGYFAKGCTFSVSAINLGNTDQNLQLFADDPEDGCTYQFAQERLQLAPGQQKDVELSVHPTHIPLIGSTRLFGFAASTRGVENPHVVANGQAQIERKPLLTPATLLIALAVLVLASMWFIMRPVPARMDSFAASQSEIIFGESVSVSWNARNATSVRITADGNDLAVNLPPSGESKFQINTDTIFRVYAVNDLGESNPIEVLVKVKHPVPVPLPDIKTFKVSKSSFRVGEVAVVSYEAVGAEKLVLQPLGVELPLNQDRFSFTVSQPGSMELTLYAYNKVQQASKQTKTISVTEPSRAKIIAFQALYDGQPVAGEVEAGAPLVLEWQVTGAVRAEIQPGFPGVDSLQGTVSVAPLKTTTYTLIVKDEEGRSASQKITVKVKPPPEGPPPPL